MPTYVEHQCCHCKKTFQVQLKYHNSGRGRYCSKKCQSEASKTPKDLNSICCLCHEPFYASASRKLNSKSGFIFCSTKCKNNALSIGVGFESMLPHHYGSSTSGQSKTYRRIAFKHHPAKCADCGWDKYKEVLEVHHLDMDRTNNTPKNLVILCPTCHTVRHFLDNTGSFLGKKRLERDIGNDPISSAWKAEALTMKTNPA